MVNLFLSGFVCVLICIAGVTCSCEYCSNHHHHCIRLHTTAYVHPSNSLDSLISSLIGKRTVEVLYSPCYTGSCLPDLGETYRSHGTTFVKVSTISLHNGRRYMWAYASDVTLQCSHTGYSYNPFMVTHRTLASTKFTTTTRSTTPIISSSTTKSTTTKTGTVVPNSTTVPVCDKISLLSAVMHHEKEVNQNATLCTDGTHAQSEAVLMNFCNAPSTKSWFKGKQVMTHCSTLPLYAPIASFKDDQYHHEALGSSGLFVGCTPDGFEMMSQKCGGMVEITSIDGSTAYHFFVVHW